MSTLLAEARTPQTLRHERGDDPGAAFTIEVAILRTSAELECVAAAEARAGQRLVDLNMSADEETTGETPAASRRADRRQAG